MTVRMRHTRSHSNKRRSHHALKGSAFSVCQNCKNEKTPHVICQNCGFYNGRQVVDVLKKLDKKERKKKEKELEEQAEKQGKPLSASELSQKT
ncbi:50S ribosomal protein L32 [Candidatus Giovannonibacteria bacterium RIFCSPHIGHO2_02_42_15]|uniref:Large ribosomal subunit protein bL32 n=2 Tax=Candidatus Giovannoniibacteriota TaxID=1752738 RepID=A0A1F5VMK7_9BACT|nr:MAG: 50S ribosomal protein L32 [Candidatus Giovannonibacteria bacterium GW2011_GWF2_42_19]OGF64646.1 MAG: 50S ribosomal protein L32 [Candidatus Giovannonibacteria bacterium RIFCSPHIGHO2_02_42_15]